MKANVLPLLARIERSASDRLTIAIEAVSQAPWRMVLLRSTWQSLGTALAAAYVADCYFGAHPQQQRHHDRASLVSAIQLTLPTL